MKKAIRHLFFLLNLFVAIGLVATYFVGNINPEKHWIPSVWGYFYPYLLVANIAFILLWITMYWRYVFLSILCIVFGIAPLKNYFGLSPKTTSEEGIKVLSYNVRNFYGFLEKKDTEKSMLDFIASQDANIICLQEAKLQKKGELNPLKLKKLFPGIIHCQLAHTSSWNGLVTFSSFPIIKMGEIRFEESANMVLFTDVRTEIDTIRIYNCHLQSYHIIENDYQILDTVKLESEQIKEVRRIGAKLRDANIIRAKQVQELASHIRKCIYPILLCGDFNDIPLSFTYKTISNELTDAFVESGSGISTTYRGKLPPFRIDYIFHSTEFEAFNYKKLNAIYSDHYPISATLLRKNTD